MLRIALEGDEMAGLSVWSGPARVLLAATVASSVGTGLSQTGMLLALSGPAHPTRVLAFVSIGWLLGTVLGTTIAARTTDRARSLPHRAAAADVAAAAVSAVAALVGVHAPVAFALTGAAVLAASAIGANARQVLAARYFATDTGQFTAISNAFAGPAAVVGGALAAYLVHTDSSLRPMFAADAASFLVAAVLRGLLPPAPAPELPPTGSSDRRTGRPRWGALALPGVGSLVLVFCLAQLAEAVAVRLFVPVVVTVFGAPVGLVPTLEGVSLLGALLATLVLPQVRRRVSSARVLLAGTLLGLAACVAGYGLAPVVWVLVPLEALLALLGAVAGAALVDALVEVTPQRATGQAFAALLAAGNLAQAAALAGLGVVADRVGLRTTLVLAGLPLLAAAPVALRTPPAAAPSPAVTDPAPTRSGHRSRP